MENWANGFTPSGTFVSPQDYVIAQNIVGGATYYSASTAYQTVYGGSDGVGGVDGLDMTTLMAAVWADLATAGGSVIIKGDGTYTFKTGISFSPSIYTYTCGMSIPDNCMLIVEKGAILTQADDVNLNMMIANAAWVDCTFGTAFSQNITVDCYGIIDMNYANQSGLGVGNECSPVRMYYVNQCSFPHLRGQNYGRYGVLCINGTNIDIGVVKGEDGYDAANYAGVIFVTGVETNGVTIDTVYGHNIAGAAVYLEDHPVNVAIGKIIAINDAQVGVQATAFSVAIATNFHVGSIIAVNMNRGVTIDCQNADVELHGKIDSVFVINSYYDGIQITNSGASDFSTNLMDLQFGRVTSLNNGQGGGTYAGVNIAVYCSGISFDYLYSSDTQAGKTQQWGLICNLVDSITVTAGDLRENASGGKNVASATNLFFGNIIGYSTSSAGAATGTAAEQTIAHGLTVAPSSVSIVPDNSGTAVSNVWADATNIYATVSNGRSYKWKATV
jgi:hypothetical protein